MFEKLTVKFERIRKIGSGGMAQIYLVRNKLTNTEEAIKILDPSFKNDIAKQKRFQEEMRLLKKVESPYVVKFYGGEFQEEISYLRMEFVDGYILKDFIKKRTCLTVDETVEFAKQLALGFDEIHKHGIIHRDIKSQNIMIANNGRVKIVDFGIALDEETERVTKTDMLIGSPQYVSPELIDKEIPTVASDIYAFGILIFEMLTGKVPFSGKDSLDTLRKHQKNQLPRIATNFENVPISLENIVIRATARIASDRYHTMYDLYKDLKKCLLPEKNNEQLLLIGKKKTLSIQEIINSKSFIYLIFGLLIFTLLLAIIFLMAEVV